MAWNGWFELGGVEIINCERVEAYAKEVPWFRPTFCTDVVHQLLGHTPYRSPMIDDAPWTDPDVPASYDFLGVYPLSVEGIESSSRTAEVAESASDGGIPGRVRHATKQVVFNVVLVATSDAGAEYGSRWLNRALLSGPCGPDTDCYGTTLCYLSSEPVLYASAPHPAGSTPAVLWGGDAFSEASSTDTSFDLFSGGDATTEAPILTRSTSIFTVNTTEEQLSAVECMTDYLRSLRKVAVITGPTVTARHDMSDGGAAWVATFTAVAGQPFQIGPEMEVVRGFLDPLVAVPWAGGIEPAGAAIDFDGYMTASDEACNPPLVQPLFDPLHPALVLPPSVPSVPLGFFTPPVSWRRRQFTIPKQYVPTWGEMVPRLSVHARTSELRNLRVRFYADPFQIGDIADDPCAFCGDFVISWVPQGATLTIDGVEETVTALSGGSLQRADSLVFATDGTPFSWPTLTCGFGYVVTLDLPATMEPPVVDLSLFEKIA